MLSTLRLPIVATLILAAPAVQDTDERVAAWSEDLTHLVRGLEEKHPDLYFGIPSEEFAAAVTGLRERLSQLSDEAIAVEIMRLVALISRAGRDGHSGAIPMRFHLLPVQLYRFEDGWFVVSAREEELVGLRVVAIGGVPIEEVCARLAPLLTCDNDWNRLDKTPMALLATETLHVLGITPDGTRARLTVADPEGAERDVELAGTTRSEYAEWGTFPPRLLPKVGSPLWMQRRDWGFWMKVLPEEKAMYVQYNVVGSDNGRGETLADFAERIVRTFEERELERVVIDLRQNGGGNNGTFGPLIVALRGSEALNQRGRLYALIGRRTFSAAGNFVTVLEKRTNALLVGEPTGGAPNQYGDARAVSLPNHPEVLVRVSTRYHAFGGPEDERLTHEPHLPVGMPAADYFAGRDPELELALTWKE